MSESNLANSLLINNNTNNTNNYRSEISESKKAIEQEEYSKIMNKSFASHQSKDKILILVSLDFQNQKRMRLHSNTLFAYQVN